MGGDWEEMSREHLQPNPPFLCYVHMSYTVSVKTSVSFSLQYLDTIRITICINAPFAAHWVKSCFTVL